MEGAPSLCSMLCPAALDSGAVNHQEVTLFTNGFKFWFYVWSGTRVIHNPTSCSASLTEPLESQPFFPSAFPLRGSPKAKPRRLLVGLDHSQARARGWQCSWCPGIASPTSSFPTGRRKEQGSLSGSPTAAAFNGNHGEDGARPPEVSC